MFFIASSSPAIAQYKLQWLACCVTLPVALQGVTTCLFPLTVLKTRQMAIPGAPTGLWVRCTCLSVSQLCYVHQEPAFQSCFDYIQKHTCTRLPPVFFLQGAKETARAILKTDGISGLYRGFGTVVFGAIPSRIVSHHCPIAAAVCWHPCCITCCHLLV